MRNNNGAGEFGARLKAVRSSRSLGSFATELGVHKNTLARYERGESAPDAPLLARIASTHGVSPAWLLLGEGQMCGKTPAESENEHNFLPFSIEGDAMSPTIADGDIIFADTQRNAYESDGLYLVSMGPWRAARRLQALPGGKMNIISDNPLYPPHLIEVQASPEAFSIMGKIVRIVKRA